MEFTGERYMPGICENSSMAYEHWQRYLAANKLVKGKVVLDIACGEGYGSNLMSQNASKVIGIDINNEIIEHASKKYVRDNLSFQCGSIQKLNFADQSIDIIVSFETFEHVDVKMQNDFLGEANRVLKKDGILFISCPNKKVASDFAWDTWQYKNEFHVKEYYINEFNDLLKQYFEHVQLLFQRYEVALLLNSNNADSLDIIMSNHNKEYEHTQNILAICSKSRARYTRLNSIILDSKNTYLNNLATIADLQKHSNNLQRYSEELQKHSNQLEILNSDLLNQNNELQARVNNLNNYNNTLQQENTSLKEQLCNLESLNREIKCQNDKLQQENIRVPDLVKEISSLQLLNKGTQNQNSELQVQVNNLRDKVVNLQITNRDLESQVNMLKPLADELYRIYDTRSWKALNIIYNLRRKIMKKTKQ